MRWVPQSRPLRRSHVVRRFLWLPKRLWSPTLLRTEWRWLEVAKWSRVPRRCNGTGYYDKQWENA